MRVDIGILIGRTQPSQLTSSPDLEEEAWRLSACEWVLLFCSPLFFFIFFYLYALKKKENETLKKNSDDRKEIHITTLLLSGRERGQLVS